MRKVVRHHRVQDFPPEVGWWEHNVRGWVKRETRLMRQVNVVRSRRVQDSPPEVGWWEQFVRGETRFLRWGINESRRYRCLLQKRIVRFFHFEGQAARHFFCGGLCWGRKTLPSTTISSLYYSRSVHVKYIFSHAIHCGGHSPGLWFSPREGSADALPIYHAGGCLHVAATKMLPRFYMVFNSFVIVVYIIILYTAVISYNASIFQNPIFNKKNDFQMDRQR